MADKFASWSSYNYVLGNTVMLVDPDGRSAKRVDNEYVKDKKTGEVRQVGTTGGDEFDIVSEGTFHDDGSITIDGSTTEVLEVNVWVDEVGEMSSRSPGLYRIGAGNPALITFDGADDPIFQVISGAGAMKAAGGFLPYLQSYADDFTTLGLAKITKPYKRPSYSVTRKQRKAVQGQPCVDCGTSASKMVADHKDPLVKEYYRTGTIDKKKMRSVSSVQPQCPTCSSKQGGQLSGFSKKMKKKLGL